MLKIRGHTYARSQPRQCGAFVFPGHGEVDPEIAGGRAAGVGGPCRLTRAAPRGRRSPQRPSVDGRSGPRLERRAPCRSAPRPGAPPPSRPRARPWPSATAAAATISASHGRASRVHGRAAPPAGGAGSGDSICEPSPPAAAAARQLTRSITSCGSKTAARDSITATCRACARLVISSSRLRTIAARVRAHSAERSQGEASASRRRAAASSASAQRRSAAAPPRRGAPAANSRGKGSSDFTRPEERTPAR